jgi:hypothetical protein
MKSIGAAVSSNNYSTFFPLQTARFSSNSKPSRPGYPVLCLLFVARLLRRQKMSTLDLKPSNFEGFSNLSTTQKGFSFLDFALGPAHLRIKSSNA